MSTKFEFLWLVS